ncbi:hypothetical protein EOM86_01900 [Candidatus Nomurabacteria bacterium]|nr:hypothetical protein [Candidatus Nomurabacteria bacterium]
MDDVYSQKKSLVVRIFLTFIGIIAALAAGIADFVVSSLIFDHDPFGIGAVDMLPAALIGFAVFLPVILVPFFLTRKKAKPFARSYLIAGFLLLIIVLVYLGSIRFYY